MVKLSLKDDSTIDTLKRDFSGRSLSSTFSSPPGSPSSAYQNLTPSPQSSLLHAVIEGDPAVVAELLESSSLAVNSRFRGTRLLHEAAKAGHEAVVAELLSRKAEVNATNRSGCTALHSAAICKDKERGCEVVKCLLTAPSHVNVMNERMDTPLHYATYSEPSTGSGAIIICLLAGRARVNCRNKNGDSPLINAAIGNNAVLVRLLLEQKADVGHRNLPGKTAQDLAKEGSFHESLAALENNLSEDYAGPSYADMRQQAVLTGGFAGAATTMVEELSDAARSRLIHKALTTLSVEAVLPSKPQEFLQALLLLTLISRSSSGAVLLHEAKVLDVVDGLQKQVQEQGVGKRELTELMSALNKSKHSSPVRLMQISTTNGSANSTNGSSRLLRDRVLDSAHDVGAAHRQREDSEAIAEEHGPPILTMQLRGASHGKPKAPVDQGVVCSPCVSCVL